MSALVLGGWVGRHTLNADFTTIVQGLPSYKWTTQMGKNGA